MAGGDGVVRQAVAGMTHQQYPYYACPPTCAPLSPSPSAPPPQYQLLMGLRDSDEATFYTLVQQVCACRVQRRSPGGQSREVFTGSRTESI